VRCARRPEPPLGEQRSLEAFASAPVGAMAVLVLVSTVLPAATASASVPRAAAWVPFDLVVNLRNLPERYSCEDLSQKFRDVLLAVGARPENIFAYRCEKTLGPRARSPEVHVQFSLPEVLSEPARKSADLSVIRKTIELQPGHPASLGASDCHLLRQIKAALLAALPLEIVSYRLACEAPRRTQPAFRVSVRALAPAETSKLAAAAPAAPGGVAAGNGSPR
jgi:hypothetical protein